MASTDSTTTTVRAADFLDGIGVDTHIPYTDGGYANIANVQSDLDYLGIKELRDGITDGANGSASLSSYVQLAQAGQKFTFVVGGGTATNASVDATLDLIRQLEAKVPGSVTAVEGSNEINNFSSSFNGTTGLAGAVALQQYLYKTVKSDPTLSGVAVDYFTGYPADGADTAANPNPSVTSGLADYDTQHPYPRNGEAPASWIAPSTVLDNEKVGGQGKFVYTETGYTTNTSSSDGVDQTVQAKYTLDLLLDAAKDGSSHTDLYQLMDAYKTGSPQGNDGYGLFDENGNAKLAATGIHDLTTLLADDGANASSFDAQAVGYSVSGLPSTGNSLEVSKSNGTTDVAVWAEPTLWNASTKTEVAAPTSAATVSLDGTYDVSVYDLLQGTSPIATYTDVSSVNLQVSSDPLVVQLTPTGSTSTATTTTGTAVTTTPTTTATSGSTTGTTDTGTADTTTPTTTTSGSATTTSGSTTTTSGSTTTTSGSTTGTTDTGTTATTTPTTTTTSGSASTGSTSTATQHGTLPASQSWIASFIDANVSADQATYALTNLKGQSFKADVALLRDYAQDMGLSDAQAGSLLGTDANPTHDLKLVVSTVIGELKSVAHA